MKATGIVRRIDDLGRIVIPKEIRRTMRIREGDPLEIFTDKDGIVIFKKYSQMGELSEFAENYVEAIQKVSGYPTAIVDKDAVIAVSGVAKKDLLEKNISSEISEVLEDRMTYGYMEGDEHSIPLLNSTDKYRVNIACPIVSQGEPIGAVVIFSSDQVQNLGEMEEKIAQTSATVLGKMLDV